MSEENQIEVVQREAGDNSCITLAIHREDHTIGNALRHIIMKNPSVEFCAYTIPHPSENKIHVRIQTDGSMTALDAFRRGLENLEECTDFIIQSMQGELDAGNYQISDDADF